MPDSPIKKRQDRAKRSAIAKLIRSGYVVVPDDCVIGINRIGDVLIIRVCLDHHAKSDVDIIKSIPRPHSGQREIWVRQAQEKDFRIQQF